MNDAELSELLAASELVVPGEPWKQRVASRASQQLDVQRSRYRRTRTIQAVVISAGCSGLCSLVLFIAYPTDYEASAWIKESASNPAGTSDDSVNRARKILSSERGLEFVLSELDISSVPELANQMDPADELRRRTSIRNHPSAPDVFEVRFRGDSPETAQIIANLAAASIARDGKELLEGNLAALYTEHTETLRRNRQVSRVKLKSLSEELIGSPAIEDLSPPLKALGDHLVEAEIMLHELKFELKNRPSLKRAHVSEAIVEFELAKTATAQQLEDLHTSLEILSRQHDPMHSAVAELSARVVELTSRLNLERKRLRQLLERKAKDAEENIVSHLANCVETQKLTVEIYREAIVRYFGEDKRGAEVHLAVLEERRFELLVERFGERGLELKTNHLHPAEYSLLREAELPRPRFAAFAKLGYVALASFLLPLAAFVVIILWQTRKPRRAEIGSTTL